MNITVQRQKPNKREGSQGEMRLVISGRGTYLYIKGGNQWHSLNMTPSESTHTMDRRERGDFERKVRAIAGPSHSAAALSGTIMTPGGKISAPDDDPL